MVSLPPNGSPSQPELGREPALGALWEQHAPALRRHLSVFGVPNQDLDDVAQEVFLLLYGKRDVLAQVEQVDSWLKEVCRRVAAGQRRRAHRRHEIAFGDPPETPDAAPLVETALDRHQQEERLHRALARLDEHSRDLVALHELGSLPLVDVAALVHADRKTVRKRLGAALRRLSALLGSEAAGSRSGPAPDGRILAASDSPCVSSPFRVLATHPAVNIGVIGSVVVAVWPGAATLDALEVLDAQMRRAVDICGGSFAYLAVVEASTHPPNLDARQKIVSMLEEHASHIRVYATALQGGAAWIARPIMTGLSLLARPPFPMQFFNGVPSAAQWLAERHPTCSHAAGAAIVESAERLRSA